jgi:hypothetical protein
MLVMSALAIALWVGAFTPDQPAPRAAADSVARAVQSFYDWYVPLARSGDAGVTWMRAVRARRFAFAPAIVDALRRDSVASARSRDEIVGLDGDPFLNAQDPCDRYRVRAARQVGGRFLVDVVGEGGCEAHTRPDVVVELTRRAPGASGGPAWRFENFRYPDPPTDLLAMLRRLHGR